MKNTSALFICHEASRTGAPLILLRLIKWMKVNTEVCISVIIKKGGALDNDFAAVAPVLILNRRPPRFFLSRPFFNWVNNISRNPRLNRFLDHPVDLVYSNTIANGQLAAFLKNKLGAKLITHVHELSGVIKASGNKNIRSMIDATDLYLAASGPVKRVLTGSYGIPENKIAIVHEFIDPFTPDENRLKDLTVQYKPSGNEFIVGSVGFADYRKGFDLFLETARIVVRNYRKSYIRFVWVGAFGHGREKESKRFIRKNGLADHVWFTGETSKPFEFYSLFDLLFIPSREDPFPLVMLEAAWAGKPVIGFKDSGGISEFTGSDLGILIDHLNPESAARKIIELSGNLSEIKRLGAGARKEVEDKYLIDKVGPVIMQNIRGLTHSVK